jgi:hypothetical protein
MLPLLILAAASNAPSAETEALGKRLARTSGIVTIAPMMVQKDLAELANEDPSLSAEQRQRLFQIGQDEADAGIERVVGALGAAYAKRLSVHDLRKLVQQNESPEAARRRAAEPSVMLEAMTTLGSMDLKKAAAGRMCKETGKLCARH